MKINRNFSKESLVGRFLADESGASASEYAVLVALVVAAVATAISVFNLNVFHNIGTLVLSCVNGDC